MSRRTPIRELREEEATVASPRRSSRIAATTTTSTAAPAAVTTRRASASTNEDTPGRITRTKRLSLSQDSRESSVSKDGSVDSIPSMLGVSTTKLKSVTRSASKSPSSLSKADDGKDMPMRRTRSRGSVSSLIDEETKKEDRVGSPAPTKLAARRRSTRSTSPTSESISINTRKSTRAVSTSPNSEGTKTAVSKLKGRRVSVTDKVIPMESIEENESKMETEAKDSDETELQMETENPESEESVSDVKKDAGEESKSENRPFKKKKTMANLQTIHESNSPEVAERKSKTARYSLSLLKPQSPKMSEDEEMLKSTPDEDEESDRAKTSFSSLQTTEKSSNEEEGKLTPAKVGEHEMSKKSSAKLETPKNSKHEGVQSSPDKGGKYEVTKTSSSGLQTPEKSKDVKGVKSTPNKDNESPVTKKSPSDVQITEKLKTSDQLQPKNDAESLIEDSEESLHLHISHSDISQENLKEQKTEVTEIQGNGFNTSGSSNASDKENQQMVKENIQSPIIENLAKKKLIVLTEKLELDKTPPGLKIFKLGDLKISSFPESPDSGKQKSQLKEYSFCEPMEVDECSFEKDEKTDTNNDKSSSKILESPKVPSKQVDITEKTKESQSPQLTVSSALLESDIVRLGVSNKSHESPKVAACLSTSQSAKLSSPIRRSPRLLNQSQNDSPEEKKSVANSTPKPKFAKRSLQEDLENSIPNAVNESTLSVDERDLIADQSDAQQELDAEKKQDFSATENLDASTGDAENMEVVQDKPDTKVIEAKVATDGKKRKSSEQEEEEDPEKFNMDVADYSQPELDKSCSNDKKKRESSFSATSKDESKNDSNVEVVEKEQGKLPEKDGNVAISNVKTLKENVNNISEKLDNTSDDDNSKSEDAKFSEDSDSPVELDKSKQLQTSKSNGDGDKQEPTFSDNSDDEDMTVEQKNENASKQIQKPDDEYDYSSEDLDLEKFHEKVNKALFKTKKSEDSVSESNETSKEKRLSSSSSKKSPIVVNSDSENDKEASDLDAKINNLIANQLNNDSCSSFESVTHYLDDMAEEGEEDTPSEGSNDIIDLGESVGSSESENDSDDDYENDSFVTDDDENELLSGEEYDLGQEKKEKKKESKKKRSRIIELSDSEEEKSQTKEKPEKMKNGIEEDSDLEKMSTQPYCGLTPPSLISVRDSLSDDDKVRDVKEEEEISTTVLINKHDNLRSLEELKQEEVSVKEKTTPIKERLSLNKTHDVPKTPVVAPIFTPNNSLLENESPQSNKAARKRHSSLTIQENIKLKDIQEGNVSDRISKVVDVFCSSVKDGKDHAGNISLNISLEYVQSPLPCEETSEKEGEEQENKEVALAEGSQHEEEIKLSSKKTKKQKLAEKQDEVLDDVTHELQGVLQNRSKALYKRLERSEGENQTEGWETLSEDDVCKAKTASIDRSSKKKLSKKERNMKKKKQETESLIKEKKQIEGKNDQKKTEDSVSTLSKELELHNVSDSDSDMSQDLDKLIAGQYLKEDVTEDLSDEEEIMHKKAKKVESISLVHVQSPLLCEKTSAKDKEEQEALAEDSQPEEQIKLSSKKTKKQKLAEQQDEILGDVTHEQQGVLQNRSKALYKRLERSQRENQTEGWETLSEDDVCKAKTASIDKSSKKKLSKNERKMKKKKQEIESLVEEEKQIEEKNDQKKTEDSVSTLSKELELHSGSDSDSDMSQDLDKLITGQYLKEDVTEDLSDEEEIMHKKTEKVESLADILAKRLKKKSESDDASENIAGELVKKVKKRKAADLVQEILDTEDTAETKEKKKKLKSKTGEPTTDLPKKSKKSKNKTLRNDSDILSDEVFQEILMKKKKKSTVKEVEQQPQLTAFEVASQLRKKNKEMTQDKSSLSSNKIFPSKHDKTELTTDVSMEVQKSKITYFPSRILETLTSTKKSKDTPELPVKNKPFKKPKLVPSSKMNKRSWETEKIPTTLMPSANVKKAKKMKTDPNNEFNVKDFKNQMLYDPTRVSRMNTKALLDKKQKIKF